jgi:S-(hydroxymethyl)glutathione dehydrogenase/alcohol dehydrogenase
MRAAIARGTGYPTLDIDDTVSTASFGPGRVRIRLRAASLCHTDLSAMSGLLDHAAPFVPGHEGAGEVLEIGPGVSNVRPGDRVIVCWMPPCDACWFCTHGQSHLCTSAFRNVATPNFAVDGRPVPGMLGTGTFAQEVVLGAGAAIAVPDDLPYDIAALIGCAVTTGIGAVLNTARVPPGATVAVIGLGGVGVSIVQGARVAGASRILAVDPVGHRRDRAVLFGATEAVHPDDLADARKRITGRLGFDYTFEAVGRPAALRAAYDAARRGGTVCVVGIGGRDEPCDLTLADLFNNQRTLLPSFYGGTDIRHAYRQVIDLWRHGRIDLASMITHRLALTDINEAVRQMMTGEALRTIVDIG